MKKHCYYLILLIPFVAIISSSWNDIISNFILAITALFVILYTEEAHKLRLQGDEQKKISIMPLIILENNSDKKKIYLKNIGNGIGKNLKIIKFKSSTERNCEEYFPFPIPYLVPTEKKEIVLNRYKSCAYAELFSQSGTIRVVIQYEDLQNTKYETHIIYDALNISDTQFKLALK